MANSKTIKAIRVQIALWEIPLNVYQLIDKSYRLSGRNVTDAINEDLNTLLRFYGVKSLKALPGASLECDKISAGKGGSPFIPVSIDDASRYWLHMAIKGNVTAKAIAEACLSESIERRADHALGIQLSEEYRNARMQARIDSILQRNFWTKCIQWYLDNHTELSQEYRAFIYSNVSDYLNRKFFGMGAKQIRKVHGIPNSALLRDHVDQEYLPDITFVEKYAGTLVKRGLEPLEAIKDAVNFVGIKPRPFKSVTDKQKVN